MNKTAAGENEDRLQYASLQAENEAQMSPYKNWCGVDEEEYFTHDCQRCKFVSCGEVVVCRHIEMNRWIFRVVSIEGDDCTYQLEQ